MEPIIAPMRTALRWVELEVVVVAVGIADDVEEVESEEDDGEVVDGVVEEEAEAEAVEVGEDKEEEEVGIAEVEGIADVVEVIVAEVLDAVDAGDVEPPYIHPVPRGI